MALSLVPILYPSAFYLVSAKFNPKGEWDTGDPMSDGTMRSLTAAIAFSHPSGLTFWLALLCHSYWLGMQASRCTFDKTIMRKMETFSSQRQKSHRDLEHLQISKFPRKLDFSRGAIRPDQEPQQATSRKPSRAVCRRPGTCRCTLWF